MTKGTPMNAPRDGLSRSVPFQMERAAADGDGLTLEGYGAVFDIPTRIDSWEGRFDETIVRGAFKKTLNERTPVVQFDHGQHPLVGSLPIASIEALSEDDHGLYLRARLHDNWLVEPVRDAIRSGSVDGMSFRFSVVRDAWDQAGEVDHRSIHEVKLAELGPVVFPAYTDTTAMVRAAELAADPQFRSMYARALLLGTPADDAATDGTLDASGAAPQSADAAPGHVSLTHEARARRLRLIEQGL